MVKCRIYRASICMVTLLLAVCAGAEVYKWVDADGNVHFGDQPPTGGKTESVKVRNSKGFNPYAADASAASAKAPTSPLAAKEAKDKAAKEEAKKVATAHCEEASKAYQDSAGKYLIDLTDANGVKQHYQGHEVEGARQQLLAERDKWCAAAAK